MRDDTVPAWDEVAERALAMMRQHWRPQGYTVPNESVYPHQWLWDSCFHALVWSAAGEPAHALAELRNLFAFQADDGFVPHMTYWTAPSIHAEFWGRSGASCLTQPPMYGHALAELHRRGAGIDRELVDRALAGLRFLLRARRRDELDGRLVIAHPWESGCDDSPRWDAWYPNGWNPLEGRDIKRELVEALYFDHRTGSPLGSARFEVASAAFNALVAFNARELLTLVDDPELERAAAEIGRSLARGWDPAQVTVGDLSTPASIAEPAPWSSSVRVVEALLLVLLPECGDAIADPVFGALADPGDYGGPFGPAQVHRDEPAFDPWSYWRGPVWPQLVYLFWAAAVRRGRHHDAARLAEGLVRGARRSGFAEYWHPDTGQGLGAIPQSWAALAGVAPSLAATRHR